MIELISKNRCISCNICVQICPTNVFLKVEDDIPKIQQQSKCQTCFMCELYCPVNAIYVAPEAESLVYVKEAELPTDALGDYRRKIGWGRQKQGTLVDS